jgi:DNA-binding transcriptional LysR family regulator
MLKRMKLSQLRNLVSVAEAGSVRQASRNLNVSQSAVTKSVKQLEAELGVKLLERSSRGVMPTAAGEAIVLRAKVIEAELREARNDVEKVEGGVSGEIRVSASPSVATGLLPKVVTNFRRLRPNVNIQIEEGVYPDQLPDIRSGSINFAICLVPESPSDEGLDCELLVKDRLTPAVRSDHPLVSRHSLKLRDLLDHEWVIYRRGRTGRDIFEQTFLTNELPAPARAIYCSSFIFALKLVESSDFITLVPKHLFSSRPTLTGIVPLYLETPMPPWNVAVISRARHTLSPVCRAFLDELKRVASGAARGGR